MRAGLQNVPVELADAVDQLEDAALGVAGVLVAMARGTDELGRATREALLLLGSALGGAAREAMTFDGRLEDP